MPKLLVSVASRFDDYVKFEYMSEFVGVWVWGEDEEKGECSFVLLSEIKDVIDNGTLGCYVCFDSFLRDIRGEMLNDIFYGAERP